MQFGPDDGERGVGWGMKELNEEYHFNQGGGYSTRNETPLSQDGHDLIAGQEKLLLAAADCVYLAGLYVAALNDTAQAYAKADIESKPPAP
jgi:hypothetical protein